MLNYFFSLSPYTTENSMTLFHQSFPYSLSKRWINCFYRITATPMLYCHIRPHSRCSTISSASAHTENNSLSAPNVTKVTTRGTCEITLTWNKQSTVYYVHHKFTMTGLEFNLGLRGGWQAKHNISLHCWQTIRTAKQLFPWNLPTKASVVSTPVNYISHPG